MFKILDETSTTNGNPSEHPTFNVSSDGIQYQTPSERLQKIHHIQQQIEEAFNNVSSNSTSNATITDSIDNVNHTVQFSGYSKIHPNVLHRQLHPLISSVNSHMLSGSSILTTLPVSGDGNASGNIFSYTSTDNHGFKRSNKAAEMYQHMKNNGLFQ